MKFNTKSLLYGTLILTAANFIVRFLGFIYRIFLSRMIGPQGMGLIQLIFPVYMITVTLTASGIPIAVSRIVAQRKAINDEQGVRRVVRIALLLVTFIAFFLSGLILLNADTIAANVLHDARTRIPLMVFFPSIFIAGCSAIFKGYFYGLKNIHPSAFSEIIEQIIRIMLVTGILLSFPSLGTGASVTVVVLCMVIGELCSLLYLHARYHKHIAKKYASPATPSNMMLSKQIFLIAVPVTLTRLISALMMSANSILIPQRLMVGGMPQHEAIGTFGIISGMVMPLLFLPFTLISALSVIIIPNLSENVMLKNWTMIRDKISKSIFITCLTALPCMGLFISLGAPIGLALYRQPAVGNYLIPLAWAIIFICLQHNLSSILNGLGKQNRAAVHFIIGGLVQLGCTYFLVADPAFGIYGFIIGFILSGILVASLNLTAVIRIAKLPFQWNKWIVKPASASCLMALAIRLLFILLMRLGFSYTLSLAIALPVGFTVLAFALLALGSIPFWLIKEIRKKLFSR